MLSGLVLSGLVLSGLVDKHQKITSVGEFVVSMSSRTRPRSVLTKGSKKRKQQVQAALSATRKKPYVNTTGTVNT